MHPIYVYVYIYIIGEEGVWSIGDRVAEATPPPPPPVPSRTQTDNCNYWFLSTLTIVVEVVVVLVVVSLFVSLFVSVSQLTGRALAVCLLYIVTNRQSDLAATDWTRVNPRRPPTAPVKSHGDTRTRMRVTLTPPYRADKESWTNVDEWMNEWINGWIE